jgi:hypothetical protein
MIIAEHFVAARVFLRDGKVVDLSGMHVDDAAQLVAEIERLTNQGVIIVEDGVEVGPTCIATRPRVRES